MDNASKALRIAGAVLLGLMVTSLLIFALNAWQKYKKADYQSIQNQQTTKFNAPFDAYNKKSLRGSDMVSLGNKLNSTNRSMAGEPNYNMYSKSDTEKKNMNYRYPETDLMPVRAFVAFCSRNPPYNNIVPTDLPGQLDYEGTLTIYNNFPGDTNKYIDLDDYVQNIYNDDELVKKVKEKSGQEVRKVFKGYYFECTKVEFDNQNGRYCRLFFKQVFKIN